MSKESDGLYLGIKEDARIWKLYTEHVKNEDAWISGFLNGNLDVMLVFAGLFSAVVTAFLIESKKLLQPDSNDISVSLLLTIARSQQQVQLDLTPESITPVELPPFSIPAYAIAINILWFLALSLSLVAALLALLAKEWLGHYLRHPPQLATDDRSQTFAHQEKLALMKQWYGLEIIDLIPVLLHLSLFVFGAGLVVYLWNTCLAVALVVLGVFAATNLFYFGTAILAASIGTTPFVTRISRYLRFFILRFQHRPNNKGQNPSDLDVEKAERPSQRPNESGHHPANSSHQASETRPGPESNDTRPNRALKPLEDDATILVPSLLKIYDELGDRVLDALIEAISTMHFHWELVPFRSNPTLRLTDSGGQRPVFLRSLDVDRAAGCKEEHHQSVQLVRVAIRRLTQIAHIYNHHHVLARGNPNIDLYAEVLANLCTYISSRSAGWSDWTSDETRSILDEALAVLDKIWRNSHHFLTPDTRASVTASEFKLLFLITSYLDNLAKCNADGWRSEPGSLQAVVDRVVGYYNSAFLRVKAQLADHSNKTNTIDDTKLSGLLDHIHLATQSLGGMIEVARSYLVSGYPLQEQNVRPRDFGASGELARLAFPIPVQPSSRATQCKAQAALKSVMTVILIGGSSGSERALQDYDHSFVGTGLVNESTIERDILLNKVLSTWPWSPENTASMQAEQLLTNQLLTTALLFTLHDDLTFEKLAAADEIIQALGGREIEPDNPLFWWLVKAVRWHGATQKRNLCSVQSRLLWIISRMSDGGCTCLCDGNKTSDELGDLISLLSNLPKMDDTRRDMVVKISSTLKPNMNPEGSYLQYYLGSSEGLLSLMLVARNVAYRSSTISVILDIIAKATEQRQVPAIELLRDCAVDSFLAAIGYVLYVWESTSSIPDGRFVEGAQRLLEDRSATLDSLKRSQVLEDIKYVQKEISVANESIDWSMVGFQTKLREITSVPNGSSITPEPQGPEVTESNPSTAGGVYGNPAAGGERESE